MNLIVVDIQPAYEKYIHFDLREFFKKLLSFNGEVYYFFNGPEFDQETEGELKYWILEYMDFDEKYEEKIEKFNFFDKGYNYFRYLIDNDVDEKRIVQIVRFMYKNDLRDSRDLTDYVWSKFNKQYKDKTIERFLKMSEDCIYIPELMDELRDIYGRIKMVGGGRNECLKEVEVALQALRKPYTVDNKWIY